MVLLDTEFDYRKDSKCGDPDKDSKKLYEAHKLLWSKNLPNGEILSLEIQSRGYGRLLLKNNLTINLSSDRMCPHFVGKYSKNCSNWLTLPEQEELKHCIRTIGGHIVFPAHRRNGLTINQARGVNRIICDRFDLTLECIRRFYQNEVSPLSKTLQNYKHFFELFIDFQGYIQFFHLQDFITSEEEISFSLPFDNFKRPALPLNIEELTRYKEHTIKVIEKRNCKILNYFST